MAAKSCRARTSGLPARDGQCLICRTVIEWADSCRWPSCGHRFHEVCRLPLPDWDLCLRCQVCGTLLSMAQVIGKRREVLAKGENTCRPPETPPAHVGCPGSSCRTAARGGSLVLPCYARSSRLRGRSGLLAHPRNDPPVTGQLLAGPRWPQWPALLLERWARVHWWHREQPRGRIEWGRRLAPRPSASW